MVLGSSDRTANRKKCRSSGSGRLTMRSLMEGKDDWDHTRGYTSSRMASGLAPISNDQLSRASDTSGIDAEVSCARSENEHFRTALLGELSVFRNSSVRVVFAGSPGKPFSLQFRRREGGEQEKHRKSSGAEREKAKGEGFHQNWK